MPSRAVIVAAGGNGRRGKRGEPEKDRRAMPKHSAVAGAKVGRAMGTAHLGNLGGATAVRARDEPNHA